MPNDKSRADIDWLVKHCENLGVNCYHFLVWHQPTKWRSTACPRRTRTEAFPMPGITP
jgi:hypothetical protein